MFGLVDTQQENRVIINHSLIILKFNAYKSRDLKTLNFLRLKSDIIDLKTNWRKSMSKWYLKTGKVFQKNGGT